MLGAKNTLVGWLPLLALVALLPLGGRVSAGAYNSMLRQQQKLESALRAEISADQVEIQEIKNGIRVRMSDELLDQSGSAKLSDKGRAALDKVAPE